MDGPIRFGREAKAAQVHCNYRREPSYLRKDPSPIIPEARPAVQQEHLGRYPDPYGFSPPGASSLKRGSILSCLQAILEAVEQSSTQKEVSIYDSYADETRTGRGPCLRR
jgi:hypothetical protein